MNRLFTAVITFSLFLVTCNTKAATWEKIYVQKSTDCFRSVREVPSGGFVLAGYTANFAAHDTDGIVLRLDNNGDTIWTFTYNGPNSKEDCFYKVLPTADNGFIICGYSRSFGSGDNAIYLKLNSSGNLQWIKNWGGSGIERAQDVVQLSDGKYVICGYTTSSPAQYYDAFLLKIDGSGNTLWSKIFGGASYDDANSLLVLDDDGFLLGGQSNSQLFLIRADSGGNSIWTQTLGGSGIDNIESLCFAQGGNGFMLAGTTDGSGSGGEDGYLVKTDTGGVQIWAQTYGGNLNDGFHRIDQTSDGGYFAVGTSSEGPWPDPNYWMIKLDASGNQQWENFFGGDNHDHGYGGQPTSDGGYIICGHTHSFVSNDNNEDAYVVKTNSSGNVSNELSWIEITDLLTPVAVTCGAANTQVKVEITNNGLTTATNVPVTVEISGAINQTLSQTYPTSISPGQVKTLTFTTTIDMSGGGTFNFNCYTENDHDVLPPHNFFEESITAGVTSQPPTVTTGTHCGPGTVTISASSPDQLKWYNVPTGGASLFTGSSYTTSYITATTTYYAQAGTNCPSTRVPVDATITPGLAVPNGVDGSRCGTGSVLLSGTSAYPIKWYDTSTSTAVLSTGTSYTTPSLSASGTYYIAAENASCTSNRVAVQAVVNPLPANPTTVPGTTCGNGTVTLSATATDPVKWYNAASGGIQVGTGNTYTTPVLSASTTYYAQADDGTCLSNRVAVLATVSAIPPAPVTTSDDRCGAGIVTLTAMATDPIKWFDALVGGTQVGTGNLFNTPSITTTTTYYALTDNGPCISSRVSADAIINSIPADPLTVSVARCGDGTVDLSATASDPITWYDAATGGNIVGTGNTFTTPGISTSTIYYAITDNGLCAGNAVACTATVNALPVVSLGQDSVYTSASFYVLDPGIGFSSYLWSNSDVTQTYSASLTGNYCVTVSDANNCSATDCAYVEFSVGINENGQMNGIRIFPNPAHDFVNVENSNRHSQLMLSVLDITGKTIFNKSFVANMETIDLSILTSGIYILQLKDENTSAAYKLVIE